GVRVTQDLADSHSPSHSRAAARPMKSILRDSQQQRTRPRIADPDREASAVPLDPDTADLIDAHIGDHEAIRSVIFGRCWAASPLVADLAVSIAAGETIEECAERLALPCNPPRLHAAALQGFNSASGKTAPRGL